MSMIDDKLSDEAVIRKAWILPTKVNDEGFFAEKDSLDHTIFYAWDVHTTPDIDIIKKFSDTRQVKSQFKTYTYYLPNTVTIGYLVAHHQLEIQEARGVMERNRETMVHLRNQTRETIKKWIKQATVDELIEALVEKLNAEGSDLTMSDILERLSTY